MDLDRYLNTNRPRWERLRHLTSQVSGNPSALAPAEIDEFLQLYQRASSQLSFVRDHYDDPQLSTELNTLVAAANAALYRRTTSQAAAFRQFFAVLFPAAVWHLRRFVVVSALVTFIPTAVLAIWFVNSEAALELAIPEAARAAYLEEDFENYYSSEPAGQFATAVLINNIRVSFLAFALGAFLCVGTVALLAYNGMNLGLALGVFAEAGQQGKFWGLILPHGLLELAAVVIAGAAGLAMGWAVIAPDDQHRSVAFSTAARRSVIVILGLMLAFIVAGLLEGFVTPGLPVVPRVSIGVVVFSLFSSYIVLFGRRAASVGLTGLPSELQERYSRPIALASR